MTIETLRQFFGWCTVINLLVFSLSAIGLVTMKRFASEFHAKIFDLEASAIRRMYFHYLALYKILLLAFNLVPYLALVAMSY